MLVPTVEYTYETVLVSYPAVASDSATAVIGTLPPPTLSMIVGMLGKTAPLHKSIIELPVPNPTWNEDQ